MPPFPTKNASKFVKTARSCHLSFMPATIFSRFSVWAWLLLSSYTAASPGSSNASADELTLLSIKSTVLDPTGSLASWNASNHVCRWRGVTCGRRRPERVVALQMNSFALAGRISPSLGNLSFLRTLDLGNNHLEGQIAQELGRLRRLQVLNLSTNYLEGRIPADLGNCTLLLYLNLENNHLQGAIPAEVGFLKDLLRLNLYANDLSGEIPPLLGNFSSIKSIDLGNNTFSGAAPSTLDRLPNLTFLSFQFNSLSGAIPPTIWNISSLRTLALMGNALNGTIPPNAFGNLPNLQVLLLSINQFDGHIPASVANASNLLDFEIAYNSFSGTVPPTVGDLQNLQYLVLAANRFEAEEPKDWTFMTALTNCSQLIWLELDINRFAGALPSSISNLSTSLTRLSLSQNEISGNIPANIGSLLGLQNLQLQNNYLIGALPPSLSTLQNLRELSFHNNNLSGQIPLSIGNLTQLNYLYLHYNSFSGRIPTTVGNLTSLLEVALANNNLEGTIPSSLFNIPTLSQSLYLSHNLLEGPIPPEIGNLKAITYFGAEFNRLSGEIPATLGECRLLQQLNLQNNLLAGSIPTTLSGLNSLEILDLSSNNFSGQIPKFLGNMTMLSYLNLSFNNLVGEVPTVGVFRNATAVSIQGNDNLCGGIHDLRLPSCPVESFKKRHRFLVISVVVPLAATLVILSLLFFFFTWCKKQSAGTPSRASMQGHPQLSYSELVKATDGFSTANLLGNGTFGSVYKGNLEDESAENTIAVAVKVLKLQTPGAVKSFTIECEAMRNLRHRNLVRIITACSSIDFSGNDFKAIVFDFMPNGSLEEWLHPNTNIQREERHLSLVQRVSILFDVAYALDYLHFHGPAPIVHCDLKPSNVLLDADLVAHVGDFGLAKILEEGCSSFQPSMSSLGFRGTIGYAPPEYGAGNMVSIQGDIYSYGILILEMITGRRPTDNTFEHGLSLRKYVDMAVNTTRVMDIIHRELVTELGNESAAVDGPANKRRVGSLISLLQLGMLCSEEMASRRVSTKDIIKELHAITKALAQGEREREGKPSTFSF